MPQGKPLSSRTGIGRSQPRPRPSRARRDTGFSPAVRLGCRTRAGAGDPEQARCEAHGGFLGLHGGEIQHRRARGRGGSRDPLTASVANAALLCRPCHDLAEARDPGMGPDGAGFWIWSWQSPLEVPVLLAAADGSFRAWFTADGGYSTSALAVAP
jgi:5-methylcytosine-specific restriction enzyme A